MDLVLWKVNKVNTKQLNQQANSEFDFNYKLKRTQNLAQHLVVNCGICKNIPDNLRKQLRAWLPRAVQVPLSNTS